MTSHTRLFLSRIGHRHHFSPVIIRYSHFSTHTNGARAESNGVSSMGIGWFSVLTSFGEFMVRKGFVIVPQGSAYIVERASKYAKTLSPGLHLMIPVKDRVSHFHSLKVRILTLSGQHVFSKDNVAMTVEARLFYKVVDPVLASYEVKNLTEAITGVAEGIIRKNVGGKSLKKILHEREILNKQIVTALCDDTKCWGVHVLNFEIRDISMTSDVKKFMIMQACTEYKKRAEILKSEGERQSFIIIAEGERIATVLIAKGEAEALEIKEAAKGKAISTVAKVLGDKGAKPALRSRIAKLCIQAFGKIAEQGSTVILPKDK